MPRSVFALSGEAPVVHQEPEWLSRRQLDSQELPGRRSSGSAWRSIVVLLVLLGILAGVHYLFRRKVSSWLTPAPAHLKIVSRLRLGFRQEVVIVDWEGVELMLGVGPSFIQTLHRRRDSSPRNSADGEGS